MSGKLIYIDKILREWTTNNYKGIRIPANNKYVDNPIEEILVYKTHIDSKSSSLLIPNRTKVSTYTPDSDGLREFLRDYNFKESKTLNMKNPSFFRIEGSSTYQHLLEHIKLINESTEYIMEIGFNAGISAINFLKNSNARVVSFDIGLHSYCWYAKMFIDNKYPGRHTLIIGDSLITIPAYNLHERNKFDIIFIDGYHSVNYAKNDILNCRHLADENTTLILDNVSPHNNSGVGPYIAMNMLMEEGEISFIKHIEINPDYSDGFAILKYNFIKPIPQILTVEEYKHIERKVPIYLLSEYINENKHTSKYNNKFSKRVDNNEKLIKIVEEYLELFKDAGLDPDRWLLSEYKSL
jgi:predicted O-methyltransferase YrrM